MKLARVPLTLVSLGALLQAAPAQTLTKIAPYPSNWGLWSATFLTPTKGFAAGDMKGLFRTDDAGLTWTKIALPGDPSAPVYNVTFINASIGIACGNSAQGSQDIYRTTDGGASWSLVPNFPLGGSWYHQDYVSQSVGFMGSNGALVRTMDSGQSWPLRSAYPTCPVIYGMDFLDANNGFVAGYQVSSNTGGVFKTTDGGANWTLVFSGSCNDVVSPAPGVLVADSGTLIYRSTNGGVDWSLASASVFTGLMDMDVVDSNVLVGVSAGGDIWRSPDRGSTWARMRIGEGDLPGNWSVDFRDALHGVVAGVQNLLYETRDGGMTWTRLNRGMSIAQWYGIAAFSDSRVALVGHHGYVQHTTDAGRHWEVKLLDPPTFGRDTAYSAVSAVGSSFAFAVGHWGGMARTVDAGASWTLMNGTVSSDYYANDVKFTDRSNGWMVGFDYSAVKKYTQRTRNGGASWEVVSGANVPGVAVDVRGSRVWVQTSGAPHWRSTDGGNTFTMFSLALNEGSSPSVMDMEFASDTLGYVCGFDGYLARTLDGGATWTQLGRQAVGKTFIGLTAVADELWVCGASQGGGNAFVQRSLDKGTTWQVWPLAGQYTAPSKLVRVGTKLYITGYMGETWCISGLKKLPLVSPIRATP
ncbi:MAG: hypothetical protein JSS66_13965 [Armatimonadetes bacterium]|nr:hypothetical protein [Armatimonadota bacterium]